MNSDLTDQYLVKLYDDLQKEHQRLLNDMKNLTQESMTKEVDIQKQITIISSLMTSTLKLRNIKKKIHLKLASN
jgi:signal transduction protein with GAF and PtsI domain